MLMAANSFFDRKVVAVDMNNQRTERQVKANLDAKCHHLILPMR